MSAGKSDDSIQVSDWLVDTSIDTISRGGESVKLEPRTMRPFVCLIDSGAQSSASRA
jgi:DNA-binding winged helix-turn-helix (wHTH) protein